MSMTYDDGESFDIEDTPRDLVYVLDVDEVGDRVHQRVGLFDLSLVGTDVEQPDPDTLEDSVEDTLRPVILKVEAHERIARLLAPMSGAIRHLIAAMILEVLDEVDGMSP